MKKYLLLPLLFLFPCFAFAQALPEISTPAWENYPKSPEVAAMMRYFDIPVSYSTGVHHLSIPIHTLSAGGIELPVSLSYHASGIRVRDVATVAGLGWSLNAGGTIVQQIQGTEDGNGFRLINTGIIDSLIRSGIDNRAGGFDISSVTRELMPDIEPVRNGSADHLVDDYYFSIGDRMGMFYNTIAERWGRGKEFYTVPLSTTKIDYDQANEKFTLTDESGARYVFGNRLVSSGSGPSTYAYAWNLQQIVSPNAKDTLTIEYMTRIPVNSIGYSGKKWHEEYMDYDGINHVILPHPEEHSNPVSYGYTDLPSRIKLRNTTVDFLYSDDREDAMTAFISTKRLAGIEVRESGILMKKVVLNHDYVTGAPLLVINKPNITNKRMFLESVVFEPVTNDASPLTYAFEYNETVKLPSYLVQNYQVKPEEYSYPEDYWGYYNGKTNRTLLPVPGANVDLEPDDAYNQAGMLTRMVYPTGGYAQFTYESQPAGGGLRIKKVEYGTSDGIQRTKRYAYEHPVYSTYRLEDYYHEELFGVHVDDLRFVANRPPYYFESDVDAWFSPSRDPFNTGRERYYSSVTEYDGTEQQSNGSTLYEYRKMEYPLLTWDHHLLSNPLGQGSAIESPEDRIKMGHNPPVLIRQTVKDASHATVSETTYNYSFLGEDQLRPLGVKFKFKSILFEGVREYIPNEVYLNGIYVGNVEAYVNPAKLTSVEEKTFTGNGTLIRETAYRYDTTYFQLKEIRTTNSNGDVISERIQYPYDRTEPLYRTQMMGQNMLNHPIVRERYLNAASTPLEKTQTNYAAFYTGGIYPADVVKTVGNQSYTETTVHYRDGKGNPVHVEVRGKNTVYLWSCNYSHVVAEIRGATYNQIRNQFDLESFAKLGYSANHQQSRQTVLNQLKTALPDALFTTFEYGALGMICQTDPSGRNLYYEYDGQGRLKSIKDDNGHLIESYEYNYVSN